MSRPSARLSVTIDSQALAVEPGLTILQAARRNGIYIPTLCFLEGLSAFGGCRMCIVEVEGTNRFPTACTTPVDDGMVIRTNTAQVQAVRAEVLQLILSEHPASCLVCDEKDECRTFSGTIRKAGVTTGCRYCPGDSACELQQLAEKLGVAEIHYPVSYRNLRLEKEDPFYDRDYNLCVLCGRCIRVCQEVRAAGTLAFTQRGNSTVIGPAFGRTHLAAGCEFCGACVSVCPTGALAEKTRKWEPAAERQQITTCAFCGIGCQLAVQVSGSTVVGSLPAEGLSPNDGQLCVKGRFCIPELVNDHRRLLRPQSLQGGTRVEVSWDGAIALAAEKLAVCAPDRFQLLASPNCSNEDLYVAQKFARAVIGSSQIDTSARAFYGAGFPAYLRLLPLAVPLAQLQRATFILAVGLDTRYGRSVAGVALRRAVDRGARLITIHPHAHNLALIAQQWLQPPVTTEGELLATLTALAGQGRGRPRSAAAKKKAEAPDEGPAAVATWLREAKAPVILVGSEVLHRSDTPEILENIEKLARTVGAGVVPLPVHNNLVGSLLMGAYGELLPGGRAANDDAGTSGRHGGRAASGDTSVLYLVGEVPPAQLSHDVFVIAQSIYAPEAHDRIDLALPAAAFPEVDGSVVNGERRILRLHQAVPPPGEALPDWEILCRIARAMGATGFEFTSAEEIHEEIASVVAGFSDFNKPPSKAVEFRCEVATEPPRAAPFAAISEAKASPYTLRAKPVEHSYRGVSLASRVAGAGRLFAEGVLEINPDDARDEGVASDDAVVVTGGHFERTWSARVVATQPKGVLGVTLPQAETVGLNPNRVRMTKHHG